jgi:hypothetical protein
VDRWNLKIINLSTHYEPGLELELNLSPKEREKTNQPGILDAWSGGGWGRLLSMGAPNSPVRHRTLSGALATSPNRSGSGASDSWRLYPLVAPDSPVPHWIDTVQCLVRL